MNRKVLITAAILGGLSVILGAFAAHGLERVITEDAIATFKTGVRYQMYHALVLLFVGSTALISNKAKRLVLYLVVIGVVLFSGSIYGLATNELSGFDFKKMGFITPIGGLILIISWVVLIINFTRIKSD